MAIAIVQSNEGTGTTATVTPTLSVAPTSGNLVALFFGAGDYNGTPNAWATQSTGMEQQAFLGAYGWWQISNGTNSFPYTVGSAVNSAWVLVEISQVAAAPYDISNGTFTNGGIGPPFPNTTPSIIPTTGQRMVIGALLSMNSSGEDNSLDTTGWTNSFTHIRTAGSTGSGERHTVSVGYRIVTGNGSTGYSTTADLVSNSALSRASLIIAFKEAITAVNVTVGVTNPALLTMTGGSVGFAGGVTSGASGRQESGGMASMGKWMGN